MNAELTPWFPPNIAPARQGFYEREYGAELCPDYWDGETWWVCFETIPTRIRGGSTLPWRGLAKKP